MSDSFKDPEVRELLGSTVPRVPGNPPAPNVVVRATPGAGKVSAIAGDAYEGASSFSRELATWQPRLGSADSEIIPNRNRMDARTRDTIRNDAYVLGGAQLHKDNIVGAVYMLNSKPAGTALGKAFDETWEEEFQAEVEEKFTLWAESVDNWPDASRLNNFTSMVRLAVGIHVVHGDVLASVEWLRSDYERRPFSTALNFIDVARLSTPPDKIGRPDVVGGIQRDKFGAPLGYYIRDAHPAELFNPESWTWSYVPARKPDPWNRIQMVYLYEQTLPGQTRGVAEMVTALAEIRMTKKFRNTVLQNAVVNATYAATIESEMPSAAVFAGIGGADEIPAAIDAYAQSYLGQIAAFTGGAKNLTMDGVKIPHLYPGTKLELRGAGEGGPLGTEFEQSLLRYIAAILGVSYEQLSRDYTKTNYSSARAAMTETWKFMQSRKKLIADRFATIVYRLWLEEALNTGMIEAMPRRFKANKDWLYQGLNQDAISRCDWIGASRGQIDELKETEAAVLRINNGLSTLELESSRLGLDWRTVFKQRARERKLAEAYGLQFGDPVKLMAATSSRDTGTDNADEQ